MEAVGDVLGVRAIEDVVVVVGLQDRYPGMRVVHHPLAHLVPQAEALLLGGEDAWEGVMKRVDLLPNEAGEPVSDDEDAYRSLARVYYRP